MKVTIIPIAISSFGIVTKGLLKGLEDIEVGGRVEIIQTIALLRTARILRRVLETWGDLLSLNSGDNTDGKNSQEVSNINNNFGDCRRIAVTESPVQSHHADVKNSQKYFLKYFQRQTNDKQAKSHSRRLGYN